MSNLKKFVRGALAATALFCLISAAAFAQDQQSSSGSQSTSSSQMPGQMGQMAQSDKQFVSHLMQANQAEVELGQLAQQKAQNPKVKQFAQRMVDDHGRMLQQTQQVASANGIQAPGSLDQQHQSLKQKLSGLSGDQFDRTYIDEMVKEHQKDVADLQKQSDAPDQSVKQLVSSSLPIIQGHLQEAQQIQSELKSGKGSQ